MLCLKNSGSYYPIALAVGYTGPRHQGFGARHPLSVRPYSTRLPLSPGRSGRDFPKPQNSRLAALDALSLRSGPSWRASIAAHTLNWIPGRTQRPVPGHPGRWGWSRAPSDYPVFTQPDRRRLAFGANDLKHRTRRQIDDAWRELPGLVVTERQIDPETGEMGWRMLPAEIAPPEDDRS